MVFLLHSELNRGAQRINIFQVTVDLVFGDNGYDIIQISLPIDYLSVASIKHCLFQILQT